MVINDHHFNASKISIIELQRIWNISTIYTVQFDGPLAP